MNRSLRTYFWALPAVLALTASPAAADPLPRSGPWQLSVPVQVMWHTDAGYEAFRRSHQGGPGIQLSRDFTPVERPLALGVELGYFNEDFTSTIAQSVGTHLTSDWLSVGVTARYAVLRWLEPYVRASGGAVHQHMALTTWSSQTLEDNSWSPFGSLGGGVMVRSAAVFYGSGLGRLGFSFAVEGGYTLAPAVSYAVSPPTPSDESVAADQVRVRATSVGSLNPSGPYFRAVFGLRF